MEKKVGKFSENLKESNNIAIIAKESEGIDSICASIGLKELIDIFLKNEKNYISSVYYLGKIPKSIEKLKNKVKLYNKIGEKTLYISFPTQHLEKINYNYDKNNKQFKLALLGFKDTVKDKKSINFKEEEEQFDMIVGVGFNNKEELFKEVPFTKRFDNFFMFNKKNLKGSTLTEGVIDLYFTEKVKPTKIASLAFFTALNKL